MLVYLDILCVLIIYRYQNFRLDRLTRHLFVGIVSSEERTYGGSASISMEYIGLFLGVDLF